MAPCKTCFYATIHGSDPGITVRPNCGAGNTDEADFTVVAVAIPKVFGLTSAGAKMLKKKPSLQSPDLVASLNPIRIHFSIWPKQTLHWRFQQGASIQSVRPRRSALRRNTRKC